ncbi:type IV secretion system DNA-binding domain-containing protein [Acidithiobacillus ferrooxidans]|uniref:type IV secretion system DNA-binding domain-containing protein n=1 Tax=Acidithiobacillus ferrooxidans TaxID=920 RepID=UPI000AC67AFE|nr:type IV secretion system DNA-binding domain-containing protein [Acidithiobacillus ferrooxidans]
MFKSIFGKAVEAAKQVATPENIAKAKEMAASAGKVAASAGQQAAKAVKSAGAAHAEKAATKVTTTAQREAQAIVNKHMSDAIDSTIGDVRRGTQITDVTSPAMRQKLREKTGPGQISVGGVPVDPGDEQQHFLLCGAPGTGKSVELKKILRTVRQRKQRAVVYDVSGELVSLYYRPGVDHILNPLDQRNELWNPWLDAESFEYAALAKSLIQDTKGGSSDPFWTDSARATLEALLMEAPDLDGLINVGLSAPISDLMQVVEMAGFGGMIGPSKTFQSTRSVLATYLRSLAMLDNVSRDDTGAFSIRRWLEEDDGSWLFFSVPSRGRDALRPLVSMWLDTVVRHVMSLPPDPERRIWLSLDELPSLNAVPSLAPALAEGRKFGLIGILGVQALGQLQERYGEKLAAALWGLPKTRLYLRISDAGTAEHVSKEIGDQQIRRETTSNSDSSSAQGASSSTSTGEQIVIERAVLPSQIAALPDLTGYLKLGGSAVVAKVIVDFAGLPRTGEQDNFQDRPMRTMRKPARPGTAQANEQQPVQVPEVQQAQAEATATPSAVVTTAQAVGFPEASTHQPDQEVDMQEIIDQYGEILRAETEFVFSQYDAEFVAAMTDDDIAELADILAERAELIYAARNPGQEG